MEADKAAKREMSGVMIVNGRIRGNISGFVDGMFYGVVKGDVNARMELGNANALLEAGKDKEYVKEEIIKEGKDETEQE